MDKITQIDQINKYNEIKAVEVAPVITSSLIGELNTIKYLVLPIKKEQVELLNNGDSFKWDYVQNSLEKLGLLDEVLDPNNEKSILFVGDLNMYSSYARIVYKFPQRRKEELLGVPAHYRYYIFMRERQIKNMHLTNICPSALDSWKSVITKIGSNYGIVIKLKAVKK
jgi:hypothetical protein